MLFTDTIQTEILKQRKDAKRLRMNNLISDDLERRYKAFQDSPGMKALQARLITIIQQENKQDNQ